MPLVYISGQDITTDNGYNKLFYPNGKVSSEGLMHDGIPDGFWKTYYPSGIIKSAGNRRNHLLDSVWIFFNESGDTVQKINYIMGKRNGYTIGYNFQPSMDPMNRGRIIAKELYVNDKREGISYYYYPNGQLKETVQYLNNKRNGIAREFDENGILITIQTYKNSVLTEREKVNRKDEKGLKQGVWKTFYPNGSLKSEIDYMDDLINGTYKEYDEEGNIKVLLQYAKGLLIEEKDTSAMEIEIRNKYDNEGNLTYSGSYRKNIPVGIHRIYNIDGNVVNAVLYSNQGTKIGEGIITNEGKKEGAWKYFNAEGSVHSNGSYTNNLLNGAWKYFYGDGKTEQTGVYKNGKTNGLWEWYYKNGNLKREEEFFEGKEEGIYVEYDTLSEVIVSGKYFDGQREGEWYYKVGDYSEKGKYVADLKDGKWQSFYSDGKLKYEGNFIQGNPDGEHVFYYPNGKIKEINYYVMGICEKNWKRFDENGLLLLTITYKDNKEFRINGEKVDFAEYDIKLFQ
jgi:antitoxin component YwqK of YwqJK toxin-antitoxin module